VERQRVGHAAVAGPEPLEDDQAQQDVEAT
jgi:hypothetical protein